MLWSNRKSKKIPRNLILTYGLFRYAALLSTKDEFFKAAEDAVNLGAAAWIFHTAAGFSLKGSTFFENLDSTEQAVIDELANRIFGSIADRVPTESLRNIEVVNGSN